MFVFVRMIGWVMIVHWKLKTSHVVDGLRTIHVHAEDMVNALNKINVIVIGDGGENIVVMIRHQKPAGNYLTIILMFVVVMDHVKVITFVLANRVGVEVIAVLKNWDSHVVDGLIKTKDRVMVMVNV